MNSVTLHNSPESIETFSLDGFFERTDIVPSLYPYPVSISHERVVEVSNNVEHWYQRVMIEETNGVYVCWYEAEELEEAKSQTDTEFWKFYRELPEQEQLVYLTAKDISEGKGVGVKPHLIRIKE